MYVDDTHFTFASNNLTQLERVVSEELARITNWLIAINSIDSLLNNKNTNNVETHTCAILPLVFLSLFIVGCWEAM